ncbi:MAG: FAD-dependent oxidoreductase [Aggregatilineales bacterium]
MRDVVIIGGGLSGLAAAYTLEKANINYTLIEVKRRLGGSVHSLQQDGFIMDEGAFAMTPLPDDVLSDLNLQDDIFALDDHSIAFKRGSHTLIDAFAQKITAPRMMRMAVSSIGQLENSTRLALCFENGLMLDAKSIIVAIPARYAERLFYSYLPAVAEILQDYHYDRILKIAAGYRSEDVPASIPELPDIGYVYAHQTTQPERVPSGHTLVQMGIRMNPVHTTKETFLASLQNDTVLKANPVSLHISYNSEADSLESHTDEHQDRMQALQALLPPHIALTGSDYSITPPVQHGIYKLHDRIQQGFDAANKVINHITG